MWQPSAQRGMMFSSVCTAVELRSCMPRTPRGVMLSSVCAAVELGSHVFGNKWTPSKRRVITAALQSSFT